MCITYDAAKEADLAEIADVHRECFPEYFISSLGQKLIISYYHEYLKEDAIFVVAKDGLNVIGFCMGYMTGSRAREKFLEHNFMRLCLRLCWLCVSLNILAITKCWNFVIGQLTKNRIASLAVLADGHLLSICAKSEYRGSGIAEELVKQFEEKLITKDIKDYVLSVYTKNSRAVKFYEHCGMIIVSNNNGEYKLYKKVDNGNGASLSP